MAGSHVVDNVELYNPDGRYKEGCYLYRNVGQGRVKTCPRSVGPDIQVAAAWRGVAAADFRQRRQAGGGCRTAQWSGRVLRAARGAGQQLAGARPPGHQEQPRRRRRTHQAGARLGL